MQFIYILGFILMSAGILLLFKISFNDISDNMQNVLSPKYTLREQALIVQGRKKGGQLKKKLRHLQNAIERTGKEKQFTLACALSVIGIVVGAVIALVLNNIFLVPVLSIACAMLPFLMVTRTVNYYDKHIRNTLETTLSTITTSYIRNEDIINSVKENINYINPPLHKIFQEFIADTTVYANVQQSIEILKSKVENDIWKEWCDTLIVCQNDRTLKDTLVSIVDKLTDVRLINNDLETIIASARFEYYAMVAIVFGNIPLLYFMNRDWYNVLVHTIQGKFTIAVICAITLFTTIKMRKYTKPIEYKIS